jgi:hypothetical protein
MANKKIEETLAAFENNAAFKYSHIPFSYKWKSWLYAAPVLLLFMTLFSFLYLLDKGLLATWYVVPYLLIFVLATVWFKAVRKHLSKKMINTPGKFITALAKPVLTYNYKVYALLSVGSNRHNRDFIEHQSQQVSSAYADLIPRLKPGVALPLLSGKEPGADILYFCCMRKFSVRKNNIGWNEEVPFAVLLIDHKQVKSILVD